MLKKQFVEQTHQAFHLARTVAFLGEYKLLHSFTRLFKPWVEVPERMEDPQLRPFILADIRKLFEKDALLFSSGLIPLRLLTPESPFEHSKRLAKILLLGVKMSRQRKTKQTKPEATQDQNLPEYFVRNFHWQIDGYLSADSAKVYDHQVEILFTGTAQAMRRLVLQPLSIYLKDFSGKAKILELGCGTGELAQTLAGSFPEHDLTISDLSAPYLKLATQKLSKLSVNIVQAAAEDLLFKDNSFDALTCVFLFHELPTEVRKKVLAEVLRVLKPGGIFIAVDSIQNGDVPEYAWALEKFPQDYHEPFYRSYTAWPMTEAFSEAGLKDVQSERGFFSKCVWGFKPA